MTHRFRKAFGRPAALAVMAVACAAIVIPALAQVPPPSRGDNGRQAPHYVDSADYDRQPYYVDGVQYKPYTPEKKKAKPAADTVKATAAQTPAYVTPEPDADLHPFVPSSAAAASKAAQSSSSSSKAAKSDDSSSSAAPQSYAPKKRSRYGVAIIEALDKVSSESVRFEAPIGQPVRYKGLIYTVKACEVAAEDETMPDVIAYIQVRTNPSNATNTSPATKSKEVFRGWTYASAPSLNPIQHPVYDAWVIACRKPLTGAAQPKS